MDDELMERISSAIDAEDGVDGDAELRALLDRDPDALLYAQDLVRIDEVLRDLGGRVREPDWDALAARIEAGLDREDSGEPLEALDAPPRFLDTDVRDGSVSQEVLVAPVAAAAASAPPPKAEAKDDTKVVDLASRRRSTVFAWTGGLAAAAAVGLGIAFGSAGFDASPSADSVAYAPAAYEEAAYDEAAEAEPSAQAAAPVVPSAVPAAPAEAPGAWDGLAAAEPAREGALPAAAVAQPAIGGARGSGGASPLAPSPAPARPMRLDAPLARAAAPRPSADTTGVPARPDRAEVLTALQAVEPSVQRCIARIDEVARVTLQVGVAGNVVSARVDPPYTGATSACIVDALRAAHLPPSAEGYTFVHVFRPAPVAGGSLARPPNASRARRAPLPAQRAESPAGTEVVDTFE